MHFASSIYTHAQANVVACLLRCGFGYSFSEGNLNGDKMWITHGRYAMFAKL